MRTLDRSLVRSARVFRSRKTRYRFNYTMHTDGVGVSLTFVHKDHDRKKRKGCRCAGCRAEREGEVPYAYVDHLTDSDIETIKGRNIVGCDPGMFSLVYMSDDKSKLRYNAFQRRTETKLKRNQRILLREKEKHGVHEVEATLLEHNARTVNVVRFKNYLRKKNEVNARLRSFYYEDVHRKMKWRQYVYGQKSEDKFLNRMASTFGSDAVIAYGDWSRSSQMRHFVPTKGVGMRKLIARRFLTVTVNEFRTSKLCCKCHRPLERDATKKKKKVFRCLICPGCDSSESKQPTFWTRDLNSALNIRELARKWMNERTRPAAFCRAAGLARTEEEKTAQSVDLSVQRASEPASKKSRRL